MEDCLQHRRVEADVRAMRAAALGRADEERGRGGGGGAGAPRPESGCPITFATYEDFAAAAARLHLRPRAGGSGGRGPPAPGAGGRGPPEPPAAQAPGARGRRAALSARPRAVCLYNCLF